MTDQPSNPGLFQQIINCQRSLYAYILRMLPHSADAKDVLQETNLVLLAKQAEFDDVQDFSAWAARIAYYQVLAHRSRQKRDRIWFSEEFVRTVADEGASAISHKDPSLQALTHCLERLPEKDRELIGRRYQDNLAARDIASAVGRSARAISQALYRVRLTLIECVRRSLATEDAR